MLSPMRAAMQRPRNGQEAAKARSPWYGERTVNEPDRRPSRGQAVTIWMRSFFEDPMPARLRSDLDLLPAEAAAAEWRLSAGLVGYQAAVAAMEARAAEIAAGRARELIWLLEHPPLYTAGTSARGADVIEPRF